MAAAQPAPFSDDLCNTSLIQDAELRALVELVNARQPVKDFKFEQQQKLLEYFSIDTQRPHIWNKAFSSELTAYLKELRTKWSLRQSARQYARRLKIKDPDRLRKNREKQYEKRRSEEYREQARDKHAKNPEIRRTSARRHYNKYKDDPGWTAQQYAKVDKDSVVYQWNCITGRARQHKIPITLTYDQLVALVQNPCEYCATVTERRGVDRKDSNRGYHLDNSAACCSNCNFSKGTLSVETFIALAHDIVRHADDQTFVSPLTCTAEILMSFASWVRQGEKRGIIITIDELAFNDLRSRDCTYCGHPTSNGIDRISSAGGYTPDNVQPCCKTCNHLKHIVSHDEFLNKLRAIILVHPIRPINPAMATDRFVHIGEVEVGVIQTERVLRKCQECGMHRNISKFFDGESRMCTRCERIARELEAE